MGEGAAARESLKPRVRQAERVTGRRRDERPYITRGGGFSYVMILPALVLVLLVLGFPLVFNLFLSVTDASQFTGFDRMSFIGLRNFVRVFGEFRFAEALKLDLMWTSSNLVLQMALGLVLALILQDAPSRLARFFQPLWLIPWVVPGVAAFYAWRLLYNPEIGQIHELLAGAGIIDKAILADPVNAIWGIVAAAVWKGFPFYMVVFYSGLQAVPVDLYDAARVDGANRWHVFRYIELPELVIIAAPAAVLGFIWIFNWFVPIYVMTEGGPGGATTTIAYYIVEEALRRFRYGQSAVAGTALICLVSLLFLVSNVLRRRSEVNE
jgi:multiple sugar transport system permease protein